MAYKGGVGGGSYIARKSRNGIAVVWAMLMSGVNKGMIDSCTHKKSKIISCIGQHSPREKPTGPTGAHTPNWTLPLRQLGEPLPESRCFVEDKRPLCQLSSKRSENNWQSGILSSTDPPLYPQRAATPPPRAVAPLWRRGRYCWTHAPRRRGFNGDNCSHTGARTNKTLLLTMSPREGAC